MSTEKFTEGTDLLQIGRTTEAINWFQETVGSVIETQSRQMEFAKGIYTRTISNSCGEIKKANVINSASIISKKMIEMMQQNVEIISNFSDAAARIIIEFDNPADSIPFSKKMMQTLIEAFDKQTAVITELNQKSFDYMGTQLNTAKIVFIPTLEKAKKELEANFKSSKDILKEIAEAYIKPETPGIEASKKMFEEVNAEIKNMADNNLKLWSKLMNAYNSSYNLTKSAGGIFNKNHYSGNGNFKIQKTKTLVKS